MQTFAGKILEFNRGLTFDVRLPKGVQVMHPMKSYEGVEKIMTSFYHKFYEDNHTRVMIFGINPGRFGAGLTGIPFTDSVRLEKVCGIKYYNEQTKEKSSEFIYEVIARYGGVEKFYRDFYITAVSPLGFTQNGKTGNRVNMNYYDSPALLKLVEPFIEKSWRTQLEMGFRRDVCICLGVGKNEAYFRKLNALHVFFGNIISLEHPRYIMQYRQKEISQYIDKYVNALQGVV
jgi:hypothetical protein